MSRPDPVTREISPCKDCTERHTACHDKCENYKAWKVMLEDLNKERRKYAKRPWPKVNGCW